MGSVPADVSTGDLDDGATDSPANGVDDLYDLAVKFNTVKNALGNAWDLDIGDGLKDDGAGALALRLTATPGLEISASALQVKVDGATIERAAGGIGVIDASIDTTQLADDAVTLAKIAAGTAGNLITYDASGNPAAVATGTAGQLLTSNGAGAAPTFQDPAAAGWVPITTSSTTSATSIDFTGLDGTYNAYAFVFNDIKPLVGDGQLLMRVGTGATPTWATGGSYHYNGNTNGTNTKGSLATSVVVSGSVVSASAADGGLHGVLYLHDPSDTSSDTVTQSHVAYHGNTADQVEQATIAGKYNDTAAVTAIRFFFGSRNISGAVQAYGLKTPT